MQPEDLYPLGGCVLNTLQDVYNKAATEKACNAYKNRNTGNNQWDHCPDCTLLNDQNLLYYCESKGMHIGGDELHYYCTQNGAGDSVAW